MPLYDFRCPLGHVTAKRCLFSERELPLLCECGGESRAVFSPNSNVFVPIAFRQVLADGSPGGGGLSWSDFHDRSEKELARDPNVEKASRVWSQPNNGAPGIAKGISMAEALAIAKEKTND